MSLKPARILLAFLLLALFAARGATGGGDDEKGPARYGETPEELVPYRRLGEPYKRYFTEPPTYRGPVEEDLDPATLAAVPIGVIAPLTGLDLDVGVRMQHGVTLAVEEANAAGGYRGLLPFETLVRNENEAWGAAANAVVELVVEHEALGVIGALEDSASHVMTRVLLKVEVPMVNTGGPDPTLTEHMIPWLVRMRPDDRQTSYRLAKKIFEEDGRTRVAVFRSNDRYGRTGTAELVDAARRLQRPILLEVRFDNQGADLEAQIERLRKVQPDAIVLWGRAVPTGRALRALRAAGLQQPVYGPDRLVDDAFLEAAGKAAEGLVVSYPFDPTQTSEAWRGFAERYAARFSKAPDAVAAYAYDGARFLIEAIREAGLNRAKVRERLYAPETFAGVGHTIRFDTTRNNVEPCVLGRCVDGGWRFD